MHSVILCVTNLLLIVAGFHVSKRRYNDVRVDKRLKSSQLSVFPEIFDSVFRSGYRTGF